MVHLFTGVFEPWTVISKQHGLYLFFLFFFLSWALRTQLRGATDMTYLKSIALDAWAEGWDQLNDGAPSEPARLGTLEAKEEWDLSLLADNGDFVLTWDQGLLLGWVGWIRTI